MTEQEVKTALIGRRLMIASRCGYNVGWYIVPEPIERIEFDLDNNIAHLYAGIGKSYDIAIVGVERLSKKGECMDNKYIYRLRPRKEGE